METPATTAAAHEEADWAVDRATGLPEVWGLVAAHPGLVGAWCLMRVCRAARVGAKEFLSTLPGLVVCGGYAAGVGGVRDGVWRLDMATLRWGGLPSLVTARYDHSCCVVRGTLVVLGGKNSAGRTSSVEMLPAEEGAFVDLPPLSCGRRCRAARSGVQPRSRWMRATAPRGRCSCSEDRCRVVQYRWCTWSIWPPACAHPAGLPCSARALILLPLGYQMGASCAREDSAVAIFRRRRCGGPPVQGAPDAAWTWRQLPAMSAARHDCRGCVMSDGRFAVLGGVSSGVATSSCEALAIGDEQWMPLMPMHVARYGFACAAVAGCVIVAGGVGRNSAEVYDEVRGRWLRLPFNLPHDLGGMGSAFL
jgi:hypothetical protein